MNIVSAMMGLTIAGAAAPLLLDMSLAPVMAQKRASNFAIAESAAVVFAAAHEGEPAEPVATDTCPDLVEMEDGAYMVTCKAGQGQFAQNVTRSFRLEVTSTGYTNPTRSFAWETPSEFSHVECPVNDPWGVGWYNEHLAAGHMKACLPAPTWSEARYLESNPDDWLFDLSSWGYGAHPDY
jgi:hypothetical protein